MILDEMIMFWESIPFLIRLGLLIVFVEALAVYVSDECDEDDEIGD